MSKSQGKDDLQVTVHAAKTHLSRLIRAALAGEEVVIARGKTPVVRLQAIRQGGFRSGILKGLLDGPGPDLPAPLEEEELAAWEGGEGGGP